MESLLLQLADIADCISLPAWERGDIEITIKPDGSPVTATDVAIETALRATLATTFPADGFLGEEVGETFGSGTDDPQRVWIIDGIDGTRAFTSASPAWSTHIALTRDSSLVAGMVTCPALAKRWYSPRLGEAFIVLEGHTPEPLAVSSQTSIANSRIARWPLVSSVKPSLAHFDERISSLTPAGQACMLAARTSVSTGAMLVAEGRLDALVMLGGQAWDHAGPAAVVQAAGGRFSCLAGTDSVSTGAGLYTNGHLHDALLKTLQGPTPAEG